MSPKFDQITYQSNEHIIYCLNFMTKNWNFKILVYREHRENTYCKNKFP